MSRGLGGDFVRQNAQIFESEASKKEKSRAQRKEKKRRRHLKRLGVQPLGASKGWSPSADGEIRKLQIQKL